MKKKCFLYFRRACGSHPRGESSQTQSVLSGSQRSMVVKGVDSGASC